MFLGVPEESDAWDDCSEPPELDPSSQSSVKLVDLTDPHSSIDEKLQIFGPSHVTAVAGILATAAAAAIFGAGGTDACPDKVHVVYIATRTLPSPAFACPVQPVACPSKLASRCSCPSCRCCGDRRRCGSRRT